MNSADGLYRALLALLSERSQGGRLERRAAVGGLAGAVGVGAWDEARARGAGGITPPLTEVSHTLVEDPVVIESTDGCFTWEIQPVASSELVDGEGNSLPVYWLEGQ